MRPWCEVLHSPLRNTFGDGKIWLLVTTLLLVTLPGAHSFTTIGTRQAKGRTIKTVGYYPSGEDAVDLSTFPIEAPYNRHREWHEFVAKRRDDVKWKLGEIAVHTKYGYQVIVVGVDPGPVAADEAWLERMEVSLLPHARDQPFYWCLVDVNDRAAPVMAYVPQDSLGPTTAERAKKVKHPDAMVFFDRAEAPAKKGPSSTWCFSSGIASETPVEFHKGEAVEAFLKSKARWFPAKVTQVSPDRRIYDIDYDDKQTPKDVNMPMGRLRKPVLYRKDDIVEALFNNGMVWYRGTISKVLHKGKSKFYNILFDDGDKENSLPASKLRWWGSAERLRRSQGTDFLANAMPFNGWKLQKPNSVLEQLVSLSGAFL